MFLGIDFSGNAAQWAQRCSKPSVWIATLVSGEPDGLRLAELVSVQSLPGDGTPFDRLVDLLRTGAFTAAGIDAPFSIPEPFLPPGGHQALLRQVAHLPIKAGRPFARGHALLDLVPTITPPASPKPLRTTERYWAGQGVNTRSTLWNGARAGAPFTVACLTLLSRADRPIWPWRTGPGMLVEAFPAAQLRCWGLPHHGYGKPEQADTRACILESLAARLRFDDTQRDVMLVRPDALDATLAAFGAIAAVQAGPIVDPPPDGLIAVMAGTGGMSIPASGDGKRPPTV